METFSSFLATFSSLLPPIKQSHLSNTTTTTTTHCRRQPPPPSLPLSLATTLCNTLDSLITTYLDPPHLHPHLNPLHVLSGNFSPVADLPPTPCPSLLGSLPPPLSGGVYIRNGPNPSLPPRGPHHLIDGDGMLHSLLLPTDSRPPLLSSRHVHTYKHLLELHYDIPILPASLISFHGLSGLLRVIIFTLRILTAQFNPLHGIGLANTSLLFFSARAFALYEFDLPYSIFISPHTGDTTTISRHDFNGHLHTSMTAHPKLDPITGELLAFRYSILPPFLTFFRLDHLGRKLSDVPISSLRQPTVLHDFAITERFAIFPDVQLVMKPCFPPVQYDTGKTPRLGLLPRDAINDSEMRWFDVPGFNMMHSVNAWDEDGGSVVVLVGLNMVGDSMKHVSGRLELVRSRLEILRIEVNTGIVSRTSISSENLEFGSINQGYVGRRNRYVYAGVADPNPKISGLVKVDLELATIGYDDNVVARREFGPGCYAGEPCFVPAREDGDGAEDEGYLVTYVHDEKKDESRFVVMDARSPELEVVVEVALPQRVPYGFHGIFLTEAQLRSQRPLPM